MATTVSVSATLEVAGQTVTLDSGDIKKLKDGIVFQLNEPVDIGTTKDFVSWFNKSFHTNLNLPDKSSVPPPLDGPYGSFVNGKVRLDTLVVNQLEHFYQFGISFDLTDQPFSIVSGLELDGIGVLIKKEPPKLVVPCEAKATALTVDLEGAREFCIEKAGEYTFNQTMNYRIQIVDEEKDKDGNITIKKDPDDPKKCPTVKGVELTDTSGKITVDKAVSNPHGIGAFVVVVEAT